MLPLRASPTSRAGKRSHNTVYREGFIFQITLCNGFSGFGEIAPLEGLHKEDLMAVEEQMRLLLHLLKGVELNKTLALLNGSFSEWLLNSVGVVPETLFPSVRCGLEMAVLGALAAITACNITELLHGYTSPSSQNGEEGSFESECCKIQICALLDSNGSPEEMAFSAQELVKLGFRTLKIKVARQASPLEDAAALLAIRKMVGPDIHLRADANQRWTFSQAVEFAVAVRSCGLQYLEEPVENPKDLLRFCKETGLPVALDESLDKNVQNVIQSLGMFTHAGVAAVVIKPSSVGGFERAALIAKWAQRHGMVAVISAAFESSLSLAAYAQLAAFVDKRRLESITASELDEKDQYKQSMIPAVAHGLGTYMWLENDVVNNKRFTVKHTCDGAEVFIKDAADIFHDLTLNKDLVKLDTSFANVFSNNYMVKSSKIDYTFHMLDTQDCSKEHMHAPVLVFLHGFLGTSRDWLPLMHALSISNRCISIDLPGHGETIIKEKKTVANAQSAIDNPQPYQSCVEMAAENPLSMESIAEAVSNLLNRLGGRKVVLIGYSMGARLAMYMALRCNHQVAAAVIISGSPGLYDAVSQKERAQQDDALCLSLRLKGLDSFVDSWYKKPMWKSLRSHPRFKTFKGTRLQHQDVDTLATVLSSMSLGKQPSLWEDIAHPPVPLLLVAGKDDTKFLQIAHKMYASSQDSARKSRTTQISDRIIEGMHLSFDPHFSDKSIKEFVDQEMKKFQLEEVLSLESQELGNEGLGQGINSFEPKDGFALENKVYEEEGEASRRTTRGKTGFVSLLEVDNSGHAVHLENPLHLVNGISKFISGLRNIWKYSG